MVLVTTYVVSPVSKAKGYSGAMVDHIPNDPMCDEYVPPKPSPPLPLGSSASNPCTPCHCSSPSSLNFTTMGRRRRNRSQKVVPVVSDSTSECSICLENISDKCKYVTSCGHVFHHHCMEALKVSQASGDVAARCPLCRSLVLSFSSRLDQWRRAYRSRVYRWYPAYPTWTRRDEKTVYVFVIGELRHNGVKVADMGLEAHHREFLINNIPCMIGIPIIEFLNTK
jgi:hypothetical protein